MANGNGKLPLLHIIQVIAQFLIVPLLWLIWQMSLDLSTVKIQLARLEGRIESHQAQGEREMRATEERRVMEAEIQRLREELQSHRSKSTYDRPDKIVR